MIIVQTPLRVSLFGGGTDFPGFYTESGGAVLSLAIDKYIFVAIKYRFDRLLRVGYTRTEMVERLDDLDHELIREAFRLSAIREGVEITTTGDIPSQGSGLGSSATVTVGALHAMKALQGKLVSAERLAKDAVTIEMDILGRPVGVQDQYIVAFGGMRYLEFNHSGVLVGPRIDLPVGRRRQLNSSLLLFYTGITRDSSMVLSEQKKNINNSSSALSEMKDIARIAHDAVSVGDLSQIGTLLNRSWTLKKSLASDVSSSEIDTLFERARNAGALGGKISGAGGGGFMLLWCPGGRAESVRSELASLLELPFNIEDDGSKVIFNYTRPQLSQ